MMIDHHHHSGRSGRSITSAGGGSTAGSSVSGDSTAASSLTAGYTDPRWNRMWETFQDCVVDPADVHSTIEELMEKTTNKLSPTEIMFLQRKVRSVLRLTNDDEDDDEDDVHNNNNEETKEEISTEQQTEGQQRPASVIVTTKRIPRYPTLLSRYLVKEILPSSWCLPPTSTSSIDPSETTFLLLLHLNESLWDRVTEVAVQSMKLAGLQLDVNHHEQNQFKTTPFPSSPLEEPPRDPPGASFHSLAFLVALALRGSRMQRLQLLFYILLPPDILMTLLRRHPAGGIPSWLLEVGSDTVLSLASLSHYLLYGDAFLPEGATDASQRILHEPMRTRATSPNLLLNSEEVNEFLQSLMVAPPPPPPPKPLGTEDSKVDIIRRLQETSANGGKGSIVEDPYLTASRDCLEQTEIRSTSNTKNMSMATFFKWANVALNDLALDVIMVRLFSAGIIPTPSLELEVVTARWLEWQDASTEYTSDEKDSDESLDFMATATETQQKKDVTPKKKIRRPFGGIGGFDGKGGMGHGVLYCIDQKWWDNWEAYVGWSWAGGHTRKGTWKRPGELSTERLLNRLDNRTIPGTLGSYELMKAGLRKDVDYVVVPPGVWDILFEIYGGGPPLPRMVMPPGISGRTEFLAALNTDVSNYGVLRIPRLLTVATHPWLFHVHLCNPEDPYRDGGEAGHMSIRSMAMGAQPLWRLYSEIVARLPFPALPNSKNARTRARLWKRIDSTGGGALEDTSSKYGPWMLLCKSRFAILPSWNHEMEFQNNFDSLRDNWQAYAFYETVASIGLQNGDQILVECAVPSDRGDFSWPRSAAAEAETVRRAVDKDTKFRHLLRGVDEEGNPLPNPLDLLGMIVDARDISGQWLQASIVQVQTLVPSSDDASGEWVLMEKSADRGEAAPSSNHDGSQRKNGRNREERRQLRVDFMGRGGPSEWIDVDSERLAMAGKFARPNSVAPTVPTRHLSRGKPDGDTEVPARFGRGRPDEDADTPTNKPDKIENSAPLPSILRSSRIITDDTDAPAQPSLKFSRQESDRDMDSQGSRSVRFADDEDDEDTDTPSQPSVNFSLGKRNQNADTSGIPNTNSSGKEEGSGTPPPMPGRGRLSRGAPDVDDALAKTTGTTRSSDPQVMPQPTAANAGPDSDAKLCTFPGYGACGLVNLGNSGYANATIQCISYFPLLRAYIVSAQYRACGDLNTSNPLGTGGRVLEEFAQLQRQMWDARIGVESPTRFRALVGQVRPEFANSSKQDAKNFLDFFLEALHEDSNRVRKKPFVESIDAEWVAKTGLLRVGQEAWRRFLRRERSIMVNVAMGQVLSTISCPGCQYTSRSFNPFRLLSIPLPSTANVVFKVDVVRRADAFNCPWVLNKPRKGRDTDTRFSRNDSLAEQRQDSDQFVIEQYVFTMSRLADSGSLDLKVQNLCGIPSDRLRLCLVNEVYSQDSGEDQTLVQQQTAVAPLTGTEGPCAQFVKEGGSSGSTGPASAPVQLIAFESTVRPRPSEEETSLPEREFELSGGGETALEEDRKLEKIIEMYGNGSECRVYDTDILPIAQALSRSLWPRSEDDFRLGLRVDAIDHQGRWYPGSVVEVKGHRKSSRGSTKPPMIRVHFDNFSSKWDEKYTIDHFTQGRVRPLYSRASPRKTPTEFMVHHRYTNRTTKESNLFGQSFIVQCHSEWSTARAAAQILSQASRYLAQPLEDGEDSELRSMKIERLYNRSQTVISDLIDKLVDFDREYVHRALGVVAEENSERFRNPEFDPGPVSAALLKRLDGLLHRLPFELRVCTDYAPLGDENNDVTFPFSLERTIGNYMNARLIVVLRWREPPSEKPSPSGKTSIYLNAPVMYITPRISLDKMGAEILNNPNHEAEQSSTEVGRSGMHLRACLTEFCRVRELSASENWRCPRCADCQLGKQNLKLWRLPDILTFHIKRYKAATDWRQKITTRVNFPLSGLDMSEFCHQESPLTHHNSDGSCVYDLIAVVNHDGSMTDGRYNAICRATKCSLKGRESIAHHFNDIGGQRLEEMNHYRSEQNTGRKANYNATAADESAEPLWLQFDDDVVKPIAPHSVVSEMAYLLFYRRRRLTPSNVAKYGSLQ